LEDVFDIQDETSVAIVENLKVELSEKEKAALTKQSTEDPEAYNLYLKGRFRHSLGDQVTVVPFCHSIRHGEI
jgi:hypothetical protein